MGAVQKKTLSIVLALALALSMLGATGFQLLNAGTAQAAETLGTNLKYQNASGLMKPSDSQYAYALMWNDDAEGKFDKNTGTLKSASGYDVVRSDGKVTAHFESDSSLLSQSFYDWDGLILTSNQVRDFDGKVIANYVTGYNADGCDVVLLYDAPCYDPSLKTGLLLAEGTFDVFKKDGVVQHIPLPEFPSAADMAEIDIELGKFDQKSSAVFSITYYCPNISEEEFNKISLPGSEWAVECDRYWYEEYGSDEDDNAIPGGYIIATYGLAYNASTGMYEKAKIDKSLGNWKATETNRQSQDTWVDVESENDDCFVYRQTALSSGAVSYAIYRDDNKAGGRYVTTAKDKTGTPLLIAGYPIGAQNMRDNALMSRDIYPQNKTTGLYFATKNGKYGLIDDKGNIKVPFEYDAFSNNTYSKTSIVLMKKGSTWSFIDLAKDPAPAPAPAPATPAVAKNDVSKAKVTVSSKAYTGKKLKPSTVKVVLNGKTLKKGTDYTVSCAGGKKIGAYKVTIKGKGKYTGTAASTFTIVPKKVSVTKATPLKGGFTASWKKLSKADRKQVTGYQVRYSKDKTFKKSLGIKEVKKSSATSLKVRTLQKGKTYYMQVRAYKTVGKVKYYSAWSKTVKVKTKKR